MRKKKLGLLWGTAGITVFCAILLFIGGLRDGDWTGWQAVVAFAAITLVASIYTLRQKIGDGSNNHYPDICENCKPVSMSNGKPIENLVWWYAAGHGLRREAAAKLLNSMSAEVYKATLSEHEAYLKRFLP